ncbi:MAG TPA: Asp-tRNA(Asn)/Glu-tRNA(Gln) amidotransferase subunit GatB, partial [Candidatus Moranbacteria bacterium]|nr:Asp-tRNA(Asn)/Glu-tRNA(Gln) amidotransferase subunit GatB [Candidatus Moranbacteria bacterium]
SGTKVEVKNINSFKFVEKAINYEIKRQTEILEKGEKVIQETRGWNANRNATIAQRVKESASDYRYFPEPDIPPLEFSQDYVAKLKKELPELPAQKIERFKKEYQLPEDDIIILTEQKDLAEYFEEVASEIAEKIESGEIQAKKEKAIKLAVNYIITELRKRLAKAEQKIKDIKVTPENYAELTGLVADGKINSSAAQIVLEEMYKTGGDPSQIVEEKNLAQMDNNDELEKVIDKVLEQNKKSVEDFKSGKDNALKFLIGQTMKATKGKANPQIAQEILKRKITK